MNSLCLGWTGRNGSKIALFSPDVIKRLSIPRFLIALSKPNPFIRTPIEPTILALSTKILSAATAI
jgi:hypothetical protein